MLWIVTAWSRLKAEIITAGGIILGVLAFLAFIFSQGKSAGKTQAIEEQRGVDDAARKRMEAVPPADSASTIKRLRKGNF